jgi:hypothetical protein
VPRLAILALLCLTSTSAFAFVFDTDCKPGSLCRDGRCTGLSGDNGRDDVPVKPSGKTCVVDEDCDAGSRCIKGSGPWGVCLGG